MDFESKKVEEKEKKMTTGEKIKYYRGLRGISQETLSVLSRIGLSTIKKYELDLRNPKPDQLLKLSSALGISINLFMDFDIETASDVLSLMIKLDEQIDMNFEAEKDSEGNYIPETVKFSFNNYELNHRLSKYMKGRDICAGVQEAKKRPDLNLAAKESLKRTENYLEQVKLSVVDSNIIVSKETKNASGK